MGDSLHLPEALADRDEIVIAYHERTKHHYHRYAASLGHMDWATQPNPFRRYEGYAPRFHATGLPLAAPAPLSAGARSLSARGKRLSSPFGDDPVNEVFGIASRDWQSFHHFTVGAPVEDSRLLTLPAYGSST